MKLEVGDIFWLEVIYPTTLVKERRPVVIYAIKVNNIATVDASEFNDEDYIGKLTQYDLINALKKIDEFIDSGEESW